MATLAERPEKPPLSRTRVWKTGLAVLVLLLGLAVGLAWVSNDYQGSGGWVSFWAVLIIAAGLIALGWRLLRIEAPPRWLLALLVGSALLRLFVGVVWFAGLPDWGYASPAEAAGYVMIDAYNRDESAWELSQDEKPLWKAFQGGYRRFDQYGGLLFLSAAVYRYLGAPTHQPLLIVVLAAACSALALLFTWAFAQRAFDGEVAALAAWIMALYPEAVLLGSAQMREAFTLTLVAAAFYSLVLFLQLHAWSSLAWMLAAVALCLPFSPPFAGLLFLLLSLIALVLRPQLLRSPIWRQKRTWLAFGGLVLLIGVGIWLSWSSFAPEGVSNPMELLSWWVKKSADYQAHLTKSASGWVQKVFIFTPEWTHLPLLLGYGIVQPFLPAALGDASGAAVWRVIATWRAVGWALLLPLMIYAPLRAIRRIDREQRPGWSTRRLVLGMSLVVWIGILIAAYRGGGDQWDNPRYRAAFAGLQAVLAAWVLVAQRCAPDPWLRRAVVGIGLILLWFLPWYLRRYLYFPWPVDDVFKTLALGLASAVLFWVWDWAGHR